MAAKGNKSRWSARTIIMMMGIAIIPLLYGGLLTASYQDPIGRLDHIQAAVVNQDVPVTVASASGAEETIDLGGSLTEALINPVIAEARDSRGPRWIVKKPTRRWPTVECSPF